MAKDADFLTGINPTWCQGCGNFGIWAGVRRALAKTGAEPHTVAMFHDIGCCGNGANWYNTYGFHTLHGRALPTAVGAKLANHGLNVLVMSGDGGGYGEGGNHFVAACRSNIDVTMFVHDNRLYSLTTGQTSPTSRPGSKTKTAPHGVIEIDFNPLVSAISCGATFVARAYADEVEPLQGLVEQAVAHHGFALIDILQPCPTFNKDDSRENYRGRFYYLDPANHNKADYQAAMTAAHEWGERIPLGIFYQVSRPTYEDQLPQLKGTPLAKQPVTSGSLEPYYAQLR